MEVYWRLASADASEREAACVELVHGLLLQLHHDKPEMKKKKKRQNNKAEKKAGAESSEKLEKSARKRKSETAHSNQTEEEEDEAAPNRKAEEMGAPDSTHHPLTHTHEDNALAEDDGLHNCTPSVQYALRRLIRGVASSRQCARQGFAMALASLLEALPWVEIEPVLKTIKKSLEVTSSMKGQEKRDGLLGQLFALGAVVRSGRLVVDEADTEEAYMTRDVTEQLLSLAKRKVFLREPAVTVLSSFFEKLPLGVLQDSVLSSPLLQETLCMDIKDASADTLLLALRLHERLPSSVVESCPLLPNSKSTHALFEPSHLLSLVPIFKDSSSCHPRIHPVWSFLVELLLQESNDGGLSTPRKKKKEQQKLNNTEVAKTIDQRVASFWNLVVDNSLVTSSHERKYLSMELLQLVLPKLSAPCVHFILSKTFVRCLLDALAAKGNLLYKSAQTCLGSVCEWAKANEQRIVTAIISLQCASHGKFDNLSKTQTVKQLVALLKTKEGCFLLYNKLVELFNGANSASSVVHPIDDGTEQNGIESDDKEKRDDSIKSVDAQRYWVLEQIFSFVKQIDEQDLQWSLQKEALKFLTVNALFVGPLGARLYVKELQEELQFPELPISENARKLCLARLQNVLVNVPPTLSLAQDKKCSGSKEESAQKTTISSDLRFFFLEFCDMIDKISKVSRVQPVPEEDKDVISALQSCISQLCSMAMNGNNEQTPKVRAMSSLLMQLLLQSATTGVNDIASELLLCCKNAFGEMIEVDANGNVDEGGELPSFMDVLVDILLSLLAQSSAPIRAAAEQVFKSFCGDLTESNMLSLLRVVKKQLKSGRQVAVTPLDTGDSDDDQFLEVEDSEDDSDDIDNANNDDDNEDESDDDNAEEPKSKRLHTLASENGRVAKEKKGMQSADHDHETSKDNSDSENGSDSDMDDEAMFRIDTHLANLLKQRKASSGKGEGKDAQTQLLHFKFRVLSLVDHFFHKKASSPLCLTALPHLLQAFVLSSSAGGNAQLAERIGSILQGRLFKAKEYPKGPQVDTVAVTGMFQRCVKLASRSKVKEVRQVAQSCSLWLVKVLHGQPSQDGNVSENLMKEVQDAMNDFFSTKKCCLKRKFFLELFTRFPGIGLASLGLLLDSCRSARSEYQQHEALFLVDSILQFNTGKKSCEFKETLVLHLPALSGLLVSVIEKPPSSKAKKSESRRFCLSLLKAVAKELPEKPVKKFIGKPAYNLCISHFGASITEGSVKPKGASTVPDSHDKESTTKKRPKQKPSHDQ
eukprot:c21353_g1_i1 orf=322-4125(-)